MQMIRWLDILAQDVRYALRALGKNATFTITTVTTLALGIGASTAIFSVVNTVLLRPLPYDDSEQIYRIRTLDARGLPLGGVGKDQIEPLIEQDGIVDAAAYGYAETSSIAGRDGFAHAISEYRVSEQFFDVFTDPMTLGRGFQPGDDFDTTVLSYRIWRDIFQSDPNILGAVVDVRRSAQTIIGVASPGFEFPAGTGVWTKIWTGPGSEIILGDGYARLEAGVSSGRQGRQLQAALDVLAGRLEQLPDGRPLQFFSVPLLEDLVGDFSATVAMLSGAVGILLLIACLNVSVLLFTRGTARSREMALRGALGAERPRVFRQLMTECFVLCALGGILGVALAAGLIRISRAIGLAGLPRLETLSMDPNVLLFTAACVVTTGLVIGISPALQTARSDLTGLVRESGRAGSESSERRRLFSALVVAQITLAVVLVIAAGLLGRSYLRLAAVDPGFQTERLLTVLLNVPGRIDCGDPDCATGTGYLPVARFYEDLMLRIRALPGVESAAATTRVPLNPALFPGGRAPFMEPGEPIDLDAPSFRETRADQVSPGYFSAIGVRPVAGRLLEPTDRRDSTPVALVNEAFVRYVYPDGNAVGRNVILPGASLWAPGGLAYALGEMAAEEFEIVGVIPDMPQATLWGETEPAAYFPIEQWTVRRMAIVIRAQADDPAVLIPAVRATLANMDPSIPPVFEIYSEVLSAAVARQRLGAALMVAFGLASLLLAAVGIYGLLAYTVARRSAELAVRSALGARSSETLGMILAWALRLAATGTVLGLAGAMAMRTILARHLFEISALDPSVFLSVPLTMIAVAVLSAYLPARRAARIDPAITLRSE